jgi:predicted MFS family arabinose efflux permease
MVAVAMLFPERHLARVFASVSGVWGVATLLGPLVGGVFAEAGAWRGVFWLFAGQALAFSAASLWLLRGSARPAGGSGVPWRQLAVLTVGVTAIALADVIRGPGPALALVAGGLAILWLVLRIDANARVRLLPHRAGDLGTIVGAGYAAMFWMTAASMGFAIYGPAILQKLRGLSPLWAGYVIGVESIAWTIAAIAVASAQGRWDAFWVRFGAVCLVASLVILTAAMGQGPLAWVLLGGALLGAAFGFSWSFMTRRIMAVLSDEDRAIGTSATIAIRQTGAAAGAAISGAAANLVGFSSGLTTETAQAASIWVFASVVPVALIGGWAAFRLTGRARAA